MKTTTHSNMFIQIRSRIMANRAARIITCLIAGLLLLVGSYLLYDALRPITTPDMKQANANTVVDFLKGDYNRLSQSQQHQYMRELSAWYLQCDFQTRAEFEKHWHQTDMPKNLKQRITAQVRIASVHQLSEMYANMPPENKTQTLGQINFMINTFAGGKSTFKQWYNDAPWNEVISDPVKYRKNLDPFQRELTLSSTARERAQFVQMCKDLAQYNQKNSNR